MVSILSKIKEIGSFLWNLVLLEYGYFITVLLADIVTISD